MTRLITNKLLYGIIATAGLLVLGCDNYTTEDDVKQAREEVREEQQDVQEAKEEAAENIREEKKDVQETIKEGNEAIREEVKESQEASSEAAKTEQQFETDQARKDFAIDRETQLKETEAKIDGLEKRAADLEGAEKEALDKQIAHVRTLQERAEEEHSRMTSTTDATEWKAMREKCDAAFNELTAALNEIR